MTDDRTTAGDSGDAQPPTPARPEVRTQPTAGAQQGVHPPRPATRPPLTSEDVRRLTLYKWRYSLESSGFTAGEIGHLLFLKWLHAQGAVRG